MEAGSTLGPLTLALTMCPDGAPLADGSVDSEYCVFATHIGSCGEGGSEVELHERNKI